MNRSPVLTLLICMVAYAYSMNPVFEISIDASDTINVASELTMTMDDYTPVAGDVFFFTTPGESSSIRFTDEDLQCKEVGMGSLVISDEGDSMTLTVSDPAPSKLICTFDIQTPLQPTLDSRIMWNDNEGEPEQGTLPPFYSRFTASVSVDDKVPGAHTQYMFNIPSTLPITLNESIITFAVDGANYPFDASAVEDCSDAEGYEHEFTPDVAQQSFQIKIGTEIQTPVHDTYTFYCFLTNPSASTAQRAFLTASFDDIYKSYPYSLPTLATPALSDAAMGYTSNVAGEQIDLTLTVGATNVVTAAGEKLTFETSPAFTFTDTSACYYAVGEDSKVLQIIRESSLFSVVLDSDMSLTTPITCTGATATAHEEKTLSVTYGYEHGAVATTYTLPAMYDIPPFITTFSTDNTVPGDLATHTYTFLTEQTWDETLTLFLNVSKIVSSEPTSCTCSKSDQITFQDAMIAVKFAANSFEKLVEVTLTCVISNRATAVASPPVLEADMYDSTMDKKLTSTFSTVAFAWPMDALTVQTISFDMDRGIKASDIANIFTAYETVHFVSHAAMRVVRVAYDDDLFARDSLDVEYDVTVAFSSLSADTLDSKREAMEKRLSSYFDDVDVDSASTVFEYPSHCSDGKMNADESDQDCGGSCVGCDNFDFCHTNSDCLYNHCQTPLYVCVNSALTAGVASVLLVVVAAVFAL